MVNVGDTVLATVRTWLPGLAALPNVFYDVTPKAALQARLQQAGFQVLRVDDSGLPMSSAYGDLLVTLIPMITAYGNASDVASIVAGAAQAVGYGGAQSYAGSVVAIAAQARNVPLTTDQYQQLQVAGPQMQSNLFGIPTEYLLLGGAAVAVLLLMRK